MANNEYHFITTWRIQGDINEIVDILSDAEGLARWWPSVYLDVKVLEPGILEGSQKGLGKKVSLYTKGWLPYTLRWDFNVTEISPEKGFTITATGDFVGRGIWTFKQEGAWAIIDYDWKISAEKPLLKLFTPIMKPIFEMNHRWAMQKGEESLWLELARRHAKTDHERALIPVPPHATTTSTVPLMVGTFAALGVMYLFLRSVFRR